METPPQPMEGGHDRINRSLEELEDLVDQVILYVDPAYIDEAKLEGPGGAEFARQCREVADYLGSLAVRLEDMLGKAPGTSSGTPLDSPEAGDTGDRGDP
ncbi:MAG TPA: hypothetical protein VII47_03885 [Actinomycetota bacterium]|jgi:hypothetical protein